MKCQKCGHEAHEENGNKLFVCPSCGHFYPLSETDAIRCNLERIKYQQSKPEKRNEGQDNARPKFDTNHLTISQAILVTLGVIALSVTLVKIFDSPSKTHETNSQRYETHFEPWESRWRGNVIDWIALNRTPAGGLVSLETCSEPVWNGEGVHVINCTYLTDNVFGGKTKQNGAFYVDQQGKVFKYSHLRP